MLHGLASYITELPKDHHSLSLALSRHTLTAPVRTTEGGMKIRYLSAAGVLDVEQSAFKQLENKLPSDWLGYAAFQLVIPGAAPLDIDLLILTENRILVVELKNWKGEIKYADQ